MAIQIWEQLVIGPGQLRGGSKGQLTKSVGSSRSRNVLEVSNQKAKKSSSSSLPGLLALGSGFRLGFAAPELVEPLPSTFKDLGGHGSTRGHRRGLVDRGRHRILENFVRSGFLHGRADVLVGLERVFENSVRRLLRGRRGRGGRRRAVELERRVLETLEPSSRHLKLKNVDFFSSNFVEVDNS